MGILRFILAVNVVIYHLLDIASIGQFAVYTFFILSGFLMTTIMNDNYGYTMVGFKNYALNRFLRLYPLYWVLLLLISLSIWATSNQFANNYHYELGLPDSFISFLSNISLVYLSFNPITDTPRIAPASWALSIEIFYYLLIGLGISKNKTRTNIWFVFSVSTLLFWNIYNKNLGLSYGNFLTASLPFSMGALIYFYKDNINNKIRAYIKQPVFSMSLLFALNIISAGAVKFFFPEQWWKFDLIGAYLNLFLSFLLITLLFFQLPTIKMKKTNQVLGDLSYPIYLLHWGMASFIGWLVYSSPVKGLSSHGLIVFILSLFLTIILSFTVNKLVNNPIEKVRQKIKSKMNKGTL